MKMELLSTYDTIVNYKKFMCFTLTKCLKIELHHSLHLDELKSVSLSIDLFGIE